jgi:hypothetical protein
VACSATMLGSLTCVRLPAPVFLWILLLASQTLGCQGSGSPSAQGSSPPAPRAAAAVATSESTDDAQAALRVRRWLERRSGDQWYGVYALGTKIGHARIGARKALPDEPGGWTVGTDVEMLVKGAGRATATQMSERNYYDIEAPFALVASEMVETSGGSSRTRRLLRSAPLWKVVTTQGEEPPRTREVAPSVETLADAVALMPSDLSELRVGQESVVRVFDWLHEADTRVLVEVLAIEALQRAGVTLQTARLAVTYEAMKTTLESVIAQGGIVLETSFGVGIQLRLEEETVARSGVEGLDVLGTAIPVAAKLGDPRRVQRLHLAVSIPASLQLPGTANQIVTPREDGRLDVVITAAASDPLLDAERAPALAPDATMDSDHPAVALFAKSFVERFVDPAERAAAIRSWVHDNLAKELATHIPSASGVLARRVGDCTEHTWLFVALCRAAGIPARPIYGLMYLGDGQPSFGYHAWAEVALGGTWHPLDPTWDEAVADATHLRLGSGVQDVAGMIGQLKIEVIAHPPSAEQPTEKEEAL